MPDHVSKIFAGLFAVMLIFSGSHVLAGDVDIGTVEKNGMHINAVYIQPIPVDPVLPGMRRGADSDMHLEADIHAGKDNRQGFHAGSWMPYLGITYVITKQRSNWSTKGNLMPMAASDGPHYADNVKLNGPGEYHLRYHITPPSTNGFLRHTDKETGVDQWWQAFDLDWDFIFVGVGRKGGY
ncbi:MAG: iron transporter [Gammaproteobacteria bacterium]